MTNQMTEPLSAQIRAGGLDAAKFRSLRGALIDALSALHGAGRVHGALRINTILVDDLCQLVSLGSPAGEGSVSGDIHDLAGVLYQAASGLAPAPTEKRETDISRGRPDPLADISANMDLQDRHGLEALDVLMAGLELRPAERPASVEALRGSTAGGSGSPRTAGTEGRETRTEPRPAPTPASVNPRSTVERADYSERSTPFEGFAPEPERQPWGRWLAGVLLLGAIASAGVWLIITSSDQAPGPDGGEETLVATGSEDPVQPPPVSADNEAWIRALERDTLEGYQAYLEAFPNGRFAEEAQAEIDRYDDEAWAQAEQRNTLAGYESYLEAWPDGRHASAARERANAIRAEQEAAEADAAERARQEAADWDAAARANTVQSYDTYLAKHPTGPNASEARLRRDRLQDQVADRAAFQQAEALNTARAYEQYLSQFPSGAFQMQAVAAIDALKPAAGRTFRDCASCPLMVTLPAGTAQLGAGDTDSDASPAEGPRRPVTFAGFFAMSETEVTFAQWQVCVAGGGCSAVSNDNGWGRADRPVINVTWDDASAYATWLSRETGERYTLPSEAQWEYAARGGDTGILPGGSAAAVCAVANGAGLESGLAWANAACADPAPDRTLPAGSLVANRFGLKDMVGNVAEWTQDCNTLNLRDAPGDGSADLRGSCNQRAVRGGSWFSGPKDLRFTSRLMLRRGDSNDFTGFRVVREING